MATDTDDDDTSFNPLDLFLGGGSALLDYFTSEGTNESNVEAAKINARNANQRLDTLLASLTGTFPGGSISRDAETGSFDVRSPGFEEWAAGDPVRAGRYNALTGSFKPPFATRADAQASVDRDISNERVLLDKSLEDIGKLSARAFRDNNSGGDAARLRAMNEFSAANRINREGRGLERFFNTNKAAAEGLSADLANFSPRVPSPQAPGSAAATVGAQVPIPAAPLDLTSGTIAAASGGNLLGQIQAGLAREQGVKDRERLIRALPSGGSFNIGLGG